jgi:hypothetical protein
MSAVRNALAEQISATEINYLLCQIAFGNLPLSAPLQTAAAIGSSLIPFFANKAENFRTPALAA